jgi:hypothetical protein
MAGYLFLYLEWYMLLLQDFKEICLKLLYDKVV